MVLYLFGYLAFGSLYFIEVYPHLSLCLENPEFHGLFSIILSFGPLALLLLFRASNPGTITADNVDSYLQIYPYDSVIYRPAKCAKLMIPAVPRSRYCPWTKQRIARYDHYCPWVGAAIGEGTIRLFLLFLLSNLATISYYFVVSSKLVWWRFDTFSPALNGTQFENFVTGMAFILRNDAFLSSVCVLFCLCSRGLGVPIARQIFCISNNVTGPEIPLFRNTANFYDKGILLNWFEVIFPPFAD
jgi:hypothetical protein